MKLKSLLDTLLNDKIYYSIFELILRYKNYVKINSTGISNDISLLERKADIITEAYNESFSIIKASNNIVRYDTNMITLNNYVTNARLNTLTGNKVIIQSNALSTDISPISEYFVSNELYDSNGWYLREHVFTDEMEAELFQMSTVLSVYSAEQLRTAIERARNLPLSEREVLTIYDTMLYNSDSWVNLDKLFWGY